jgi:hypothetical protein
MMALPLELIETRPSFHYTHARPSLALSTNAARVLALTAVPAST